MKIVNWLFGSFFRTIGRTIAILLMGGLLYYILASNGIGIKDLFFDNVKAEQVVVPVTPRSNEFYFGIPNWSSGWSLDGSGNFAKNTVWSHDYVQEFWLQFSTTSFSTDVDYIEFSIIASQPDTISSTYTARYRYCNNFTCSQYCASGACAGMCEKYTCSSYTTYDGDTITDIYESSLNDYTIYAELENVNGGKPMCTMSGKNTILCPTNHLQPYKLHIYFYFYTTENTNFDFEISRHARGYYVQNQQQVIDTITNQTQQQQQQHQEMMDDNTTSAENEGSSFFGNFTTEDHGGLNAIITAPLNTIRSLLNSSCTNLTLPLPYVDKNLVLPCMNDIYTEHFGLFFSLYQTIILAIISYRCLRSIFFDIAGFTNPNDDRIEVMDL